MRKSITSILPALLAALTLLLTPVMTAQAGLLGPDKLTLKMENEMGRNFDMIIRSQMPMVGDTYITEYVDEIVQRIVKAKRPMPFRVKSAVVANPILNAFAIPGGFIYIFTGLVQEVDTEAQLAGVISHELAHVSQRHVASRIEKQKKIGMLAMAGTLAGLLLGVASGDANTLKASQALMIGSRGAATAAMLNYSQDDEREADHVGMNALVKAGYNPRGMPETFEVMLKNKWFDSGAQMPTYLSTHPGLADRIIYLNDRIKRMPKVFLDRKDDNTRLRKIQALVRSKMSPATTAMAYYNNKKRSEYTAFDYMARGIVLNRLKDRDEAEKAYTKALEMAPKEPIISREVGIFYFKSGNRSKAFQYLHMAAIKNQKDALALFYLARIQEEADQYSRAEANMRKVLELVPEDWEVHKHLGMILGESGDPFGGNLHLAYSALYSSNMRKARYHAQRAGAAAKGEAQEKQLKKLNNAIAARAKFLK